MKLILITPDRKRDYTAECVIEGFKKLNCELYASDVGNGITESCADEVLRLELHDADAIVYFFGKVRDNRPPKHHLFADINDVKKVYVDGSEWTNTGYPEQNQMKASLVCPRMRRGAHWINEPMLQAVDFYFKRETYPEDLNKGITPLPFGMMDRHITPDFEKDIDVFCVFGQTATGLREPIFRRLQELSRSSNYKICVGNSLNPEEYKSMISRSRIVIDAWGGGDNCDRFYEAVGAKSCCLYQKYQTIVPNPFLNMEHAVTYSDMNEFEVKLQLLLRDSYLSRKIGVAGFNHALGHHTSIKRAQEITNKLG